MVKKLILGGLIFLLVPFFIILLNINSVFYSEISDYEDLKEFFDGEDISGDYTEKERVHLLEVKNLVEFSKIVIAILFLLLLFLGLFLAKLSKKAFLDSLSFSAVFTLFICLFLIFLSQNFQSFFTGFHVLVFEGENWLLDSSTKLIQTFPLGYFEGVVEKILINVFFCSIGLFLAVKILKKGFK